MSNDQKYWFPAKRYGWGWGAPSTWQGWAVFVGYQLLFLTGRRTTALAVGQA